MIHIIIWEDEKREAFYGSYEETKMYADRISKEKGISYKRIA